MKIYGWEDCGPFRGDMVAAKVPAADLDFGLYLIAAELGWAQAFESFREARRAFLLEMQSQGVDGELISAARALRASDIPVTHEGA